ncbi:MAG TPA: glycosyltransferase family 39 protein [Polyangiaceae bacterium]|jgi:hypothetical protein|nr:glycosyltransferase family 39 protein [Polyangiaceae bacterium]
MTWTRFCVTAGVAARLACVLAGPGAVRTDAIAYGTLARSLAEGSSFAASPWMPGWPLWMSLFFRAGFGERAIVTGNALLGIATIALAAAIARELGRDARVAAAITAVIPSLATMPRLLASENLALPLFALATLLLVRAANRPSILRWAAFAACAAVATYVREAFIALVIAGLAVAIVKRSPSAALVTASIFAAALAPWALAHHGLTTSDRSALCIGLGDGATGGYRVVTSSCELHFGKLLMLAPAKLARFFAWDDWTCDDFFRARAAPAGMRAFYNVSWWALLLAAAAGASKKPASVLFAAIGALALVTVVTFGVGRFHAPLVPLLCVLACYRRRS